MSEPPKYETLAILYHILVFQCHYRVVTGRALDINFKRRTTTLIVVLITVTCGRELLYQVLENNLNSYLVLVTYWYQALLRDTMGLMWYLQCRLLRSSSQHLVASFQKVGGNYLLPLWIRTTN